MNIKKELSSLNETVLEELIQLLKGDVTELENTLKEVMLLKKNKKTKYKFDRGLVTVWYNLYYEKGEGGLKEYFNALDVDTVRRYHNSYCYKVSRSNDKDALIGNIVHTLTRTLKLGSVFQ